MAASSSPRKSSRTPDKKHKARKSASVEEDEVESKQEATDEGEGGTDAEEFEIESIEKADKGYHKKNKWSFFVKWKGYDKSENSWVHEDDFGSKDLIDEFFDDHPEIPENPRKRRVTGSAPNKSRKSNSSATAPAKRSGRRSNAQASEDDEPVASKSHKRKQVKDESAGEDVEMEDVKPAAKKTKKAATKKKLEQPPSPQEENGFFSPHAGSEEVEPGVFDRTGHDADAMDVYLHLPSWEDLIRSVDTVEASKADVSVYFTTTEGVKAISPSRIVQEKAPKQLIKFYENHLRWREGEADAE